MAATPKQRALLDFYAHLMEEAKARLSCIDMALAGRTGLPGPAVHEFCYLQLRMLCEVIALGRLTAHGDITPSKRLHKEYAADKIVSKLEKLHPNFYPVACTQNKRGPDEYDAVLLDDGYLTKPELLQLYRKCGDFLHRGSLRKVISPQVLRFTVIESWRKKIGDLLWFHAIFLLNKNSMVLCTLKNIEANNRVTWALLEGEQIASLLQKSA